MPNLNPNSTNYFHSFEPNTNDIHHALDYNFQGKPTLRTTDSPTNNATAAGTMTWIEQR